MAEAPFQTHATALLLGPSGVLIRGASGSGKSLLAWTLLQRPGDGLFGALVADDRVEVSAVNGRLIARAPKPLAGLIELRGRGILKIAHEPACVIRLVVDIVGKDGLERMPEPAELTTVLCGVRLPRQPVRDGGAEATRLVRAALDGLDPQDIPAA
ncbi:HPr kinase/phosphorylase [Rhodobium gokarnense]|uniref:Serine kinase of HPr protein (Carbohydrate metabolism regulator) n=1 Tax=Rhodobium gokarnense TaxID=364296 RepID=A0ABT3HEN1_9HYPH|nr:serine/threonine protein kinase [Rhodobium gokarnense]MCW2308804.1 serine kinase of HPr protein (carbohydrate metabolism regulator) [Rhodobium gokarnense]